MKTPSFVIAAFVLGTASLSGLACNHVDKPAGETSPGVEQADVAALTATRQLAFADTYAAAAANLKASLQELKRLPGKEPPETVAAVVKKIAELEGLSKSMRALAVQTQAQTQASE
jgi:hypothetical protein